MNMFNIKGIKLLFILPILFILSVLVVSYSSVEEHAEQKGGLVNADVIIEIDSTNTHWFLDVELEEGSNAYELLDIATSGHIESQWFEEYSSHLVTSVLDASSNEKEYLIVFYWEDDTWMPLSVGADLFEVEDEMVMAWALLEFGKAPTVRP